MKTVSLHTRLLFAAMIPVTVMVAAYGILTVMFRFQDLNDLQTRQAEILAEKYSLALQRSPGTGEWTPLLQQALESRYVKSLSVLAVDRKAVAQAGSTLRLPVRQLPKGQYLHSAEASDGEVYLQVIEPLQFQGETYWLAIELRPEPFAIARYQSVIITTISAFILLVVLTLLLSSALRHWLEPIGRMSRQLMRLTPENLSQRLQGDAEGDLAELQEQINALLDKVAHNVAELRQDIEQTKADLDENYQTIEAQNIELRLSRAQAIEGNRIKSAFLANISHELRTPLNSINGFSRLLLKSPLQPRQADFVDTIQKSANNLLAIINDVLDFSKIEAGKLQLDRQPFSIEEAVFDVLNMLSPQADDKGLEQIAFIYDDVPPVIEGDMLRLKQVLTNLVSNAIKFTSQGEVVVRVMLEDTRPLHHVIRISVSDTGIGLSRTAKADLFQAFQQGDPSVSRQFGGTGLGLVIAKNLVGLMEGQISFDESQEVGATFWFDFKAGVVEERPIPVIRLTSKRLLVLEPQEKSRQLIGGTLTRAEADMTLVDGWPQLLDALRQPFDAVILSSQLLGQDPRPPLQRLRESFEGLVLVLSRGYDNQLENSHIEEYRLRCLSKPVRPRQLLALLAQGFSVARLQHQSEAAGQALRPRPVALRIMAVDDHPANLKLVCTLLEDLGIEATAASSGKEAVELARRESFDLIFMDIQMPGMSGIDATRAIRANETGGKPVPIVALTAHALADERDNMLREGMNDYLTKPLQEEQLIHIIQRWTGVMVQDTGWSQSSQDPALRSATLIDWNECLTLAAGKADLARDMLDMLLGSLGVQRDKMENSMRTGNLPALLAETHYLHGATRYCGVPSLREAACQLEIALKAVLKSPSVDAERVLREPYDALLQVITALQAWQEQSPLPR